MYVQSVQRIIMYDNVRSKNKEWSKNYEYWFHFSFYITNTFSPFETIVCYFFLLWIRQELFDVYSFNLSTYILTSDGSTAIPSSYRTSSRWCWKHSDWFLLVRMLNGRNALKGTAWFRIQMSTYKQNSASLTWP